MTKTFTAQTFKYSFLRNGNIKLGDSMATWSTLMGSHDINIPELGQAVKGTCQNCAGCEKDCYVKKSYRYPSVKYSHARNTLGLRNAIDKVFKDLDAQLKKAKNKIKIVRLNQSGELENEDQFGRWCRLAENHPETKFYIYTKMYDLVIPGLLAGKVPSNFTILFSIWHDQGAAEYEMVKHLKNVKAFIYDDGEDLTVEPKVYCAAYDSNGKLNHEETCQKCGKCYVNVDAWKEVGCKAH